MFKRPDAPFLTPDSSVLTCTPWIVGSGEQTRALPESIDDWSQGTSIKLRRSVEIDRPSLLTQTGLPICAELHLVVSWISDATKIRRRVYRAPILDRQLEVDVVLDGNEIGSRTELRTTLILGRKLTDTQDWIAHETGSILLEEIQQIYLDRRQTGFPVAVVDFAYTHLPPEASWHLETTASLESRFSSSFQILINERDKKLVAAIEAETPTREQILLLDGLADGVVSETLKVAYALRRNGELALEGNEEGSVGDALSNLLKRSGDLSLEVGTDIHGMSLTRTQFEALSRSIGMGRTFG